MKRIYAVITGLLMAFTFNAQTPCEGGMAGIYPCENIDLLSHMPISEIGGGFMLNDSWGWTDADSGREFALVGRSDGTSFIEITDPLNPVYIGTLQTHTEASVWRDLKIFNDHVFIVAEAGGHGMQVFDLTILLDIISPPLDFPEGAYYGEFGHCHNIAINEETGYAYSVGTDTFSGGLHIIDINDPLNPSLAGSFGGDGYTHDAQVVIYKGDDSEYINHEIAFCSNEDNITIVDVTDKTDCIEISTGSYSQTGYTHQGWLTEDHRYFLVNDEGDELDFGNNTRTYVFDVSDLDNPVSVGFYEGSMPSIDHNLYVKGSLVFEANYASGMRVLEINDIATADLSEVGYFDTNPGESGANFDGVWNIYPYYESGVVTINSQENGFFVVMPSEELQALSIEEEKNVEVSVSPNPVSDILNINIKAEQGNTTSLDVFDLFGNKVIAIESLPILNGSFKLNLSDLATGIYILKLNDLDSTLKIVKM